MKPALYQVLFGTPSWRFLGSDLLGYWDVNYTNLITQSGGLVSSWKDKLHGYDATAATTAQPTYSATSFGGAPGITFDGTANNLTVASQPFPSGANASEVWVLVKNDGLVGDVSVRNAFNYGGAASPSQRSVGRTVATGANRATMAAGNGSSGLSAPGTVVVLDSIHVIRAQYGATSSSLITDGFADSTLAVVPATTTTRCVIGASANATRSNFWQGQIIVVMVTNALSAGKATALQNYLNNRASNPLFMSEGFDS